MMLFRFGFGYALGSILAALAFAGAITFVLLHALD